MPNQYAPATIAYWSDHVRGVEIRFIGKASYRHSDPLPSLVPGAPERVAFLHQVHSDTVVDTATDGDCGQGDGLLSAEEGLALSVVTADCVPILLAGTRHIAAVHAGWRGLVQGVLRRTLDRLGDEGPIVAWIGPCIGPCCYEVGEDVAVAIAQAASSRAIQTDHGPKPHVDLRVAAEVQLKDRRVDEIRHLGPCTQCSDTLWSYRRDGSQAGRNHAFIWRP